MPVVHLESRKPRRTFSRVHLTVYSDVPSAWTAASSGEVRMLVEMVGGPWDGDVREMHRPLPDEIVCCLPPKVTAAMMDGTEDADALLEPPRYRYLRARHVAGGRDGYVFEDVVRNSPFIEMPRMDE